VEVDKQKLLSERTTLTSEVQALQQRLDGTEALKQLHETTIAEQKDHIDRLMAQCKQVTQFHIPYVVLSEHCM